MLAIRNNQLTFMHRVKYSSRPAQIVPIACHHKHVDSSFWLRGRGRGVAECHRHGLDPCSPASQIRRRYEHRVCSCHSAKRDLITLKTCHVFALLRSHAFSWCKLNILTLLSTGRVKRLCRSTFFRIEVYAKISKEKSKILSKIQNVVCLQC